MKDTIIMDVPSFAKKILIKQLQELEQRLSSILNEERSFSQSMHIGDQYDLLFDEEIHSLNLVNKNQVLKQLSEVKDSLDRLKKRSLWSLQKMRRTDRSR